MKPENVRITKLFSFDMAHALYGHDGPCSNIHGHTYQLRVTFIGKPLKKSGHPKDGMVVDFTELKALVNEAVIKRFDHALVLNGGSPHKNLEPVLKKQFDKIVMLPFQPSCENLLLEIKNSLVQAIGKKHKLLSLRLNETPTSYAEWFLSDNER